MPKLSENQAAGLAALRRATDERGVHAVSRGVWKQFCGAGVHLRPGELLDTGAVTTVSVGYSVNGKIDHLFRPA